MKTYLDCYPCFLAQALQAGRFVTSDEAVLKRVMDDAARLIPRLADSASPPEIGAAIHALVREITGNDDPYRTVKRQNIEEALSQYDRLAAYAAAVPDRFASACRVAIAGNIIDYARGHRFDIALEIDSLFDHPMGIDDTAALRTALEHAASVLYIGDNAGESVFDRILIDEIPAPVVYAVRGIPVLNDVTLEDAELSGLHRSAALMSSGSTAPGAILGLCTEEFRMKFRRADVVIAKGQGNFEALSDADRTVFFLLRAKCPVVAAELGVEVGDLVLSAGHPRKRS